MQILFETDEILIINKPAGLLVHGDGKGNKPTVTDWVLATYPPMAGIGEPAMVAGKPLDRPGIVHRLDEDTSGVLVLAKTQASFEHLKAQFKDRLVHKEYHAFVWGHFKESVVTVNVPIGRNSSDFRKWHAGRGTRGEVRDAVTTIQAIHQFEEGGDRFSFIHAFPKTGRTHQIRVHLKYLQRTIVADTLYGETIPLALGFTRMALHARKISLTDLVGTPIIVEAPYPEDFSQALAKYGGA